jgi:hypothetical protein
MKTKQVRWKSGTAAVNRTHQQSMDWTASASQLNVWLKESKEVKARVKGA